MGDVRYRIVRFFQQGTHNRKTMKGGLTLEQVQAHCRNPETSSRTCTSKEGKALTLRRGPWFDGYEVDPG